MEPFCKLREPDTYRACDWDLENDPRGREAWIRIFADHTDSLLEHARTSDHPPQADAVSAYREAFDRVLKQVAARPTAFAPLDIYKLCKLRADLMRDHGIGDPYDRVKREENEAALAVLPQVLAALDACGEDRRVELLLRGLLAGNKFDLGAKATIDLHAQGDIDFLKTLDELPDRPWFADNADEIARRLESATSTYRKACFFVDNAGGDIVLGAIPMARHLASRGCHTVLAANDEPSLNDVTADELTEVLGLAARSDDTLADHLRAKRITTVGTGCDCPLIDLGAVSPACNAAAADCDLLVIEGMGRAVETNYDARFTCDVIHVAMIKNREVAKHLGCQLFDLIARFTPAEA